ncbi:hypothetical protein H257_10631 [Aphanomyces astaci]|uniref:Uncharacterized protein n=1 Tax=Aphanomyces astaci TaxID=112090 RepID=W4G7J4_APHAT|nr:hypothetical protein H257_10631 [Aphanomyces astaci]ETV75029.1 hypothetical protein H257_10631 [Aphanomyces astaci]|eukprot:XP_009835533.1 hypothetical protein H257_10631 [Aphanomyces astaci]
MPWRLWWASAVAQDTLPPLQHLRWVPPRRLAPPPAQPRDHTGREVYGTDTDWMSPTLLFGYNAKERFLSWLTKACAANEDDIAGLGLSISDIALAAHKQSWYGYELVGVSGGSRDDTYLKALGVINLLAERQLRNLHHSHPLFLSPVWLSGSLAVLASEVLGGTLHNPVSKLTATPHIPLYNQLRALESNMGALTNRVDEGFNAIPQDFDTRKDQANFTKVKKVVSTILSFSKYTNDEVAALTVPDKNAVFEANFASLCERLFASAGATPLGNRRIIEMTYHTVYDAINKQ